MYENDRLREHNNTANDMLNRPMSLSEVRNTATNLRNIEDMKKILDTPPTNSIQYLLESIFHLYVYAVGIGTVSVLGYLFLVQIFR